MVLTGGIKEDDTILAMVVTSESSIKSPLFNYNSGSSVKDKSGLRGLLNSSGNRRVSSYGFSRRFRRLVGCSRGRIIGFGIALLVLFVYGHLVNPLLGNCQSSTSPPNPSLRGGYTVLINTWKRNSLLKKAVGHYASCSGVNSIRVVWSENDPPAEDLAAYLRKTVSLRSQNKANVKFQLNEEDNLNNRFKPIKDLSDDAVFSIDDDVIVPCSTLDFAFSVWQTAPDTMVGFVPRMNWPDEKNGFTSYKYGGWWSVWWTGTYSMVLSKAALFHKKYLDIYTNKMPSSIRDYVNKERNCEDIAMSLLVANVSGSSPIWVKGKVYEIGSFGISSLQGHNDKRNKCLNEFISIYGTSPLVPTNMKAVDTRQEWFW